MKDRPPRRSRATVRNRYRYIELMGKRGGKVLVHAAPATTAAATSSSTTTSPMRWDIEILGNMMIGCGASRNDNRRELSRFDPLPLPRLQPSSQSNAAADCNDGDDAADSVVQQLMSLVISNRRRMARDIIDGKAIVAPKSTMPGYIASTTY